MQKKELYNRLIDEYKQLPHSSYKATWTEEVETHCFGYAYNKDLSETKERIISKINDVTQRIQSHFKQIPYLNPTSSDYLLTPN